MPHRPHDGTNAQPPAAPHETNRVWPRKPRRVWMSVLRAVWQQVDERNLGLIAAGVAFLSLLSLFPALTAVVSLWGVFADPEALRLQLSLSQQMVPTEAFRIIDDQIAQLAAAGSVSLSWAGGLSLVLSLWSARLGVGALTRGLNAVYEEPNRGGVLHVAGVIGLTLLLMAVSLLLLGVLVVVPLVLSLVPLGPLAVTAVLVVKWLSLALVLVLTLGLVYRLAPNRRPARVAWLSPGALWATGCGFWCRAGSRSISTGSAATAILMARSGRSSCCCCGSSPAHSWCCLAAR